MQLIIIFRNISYQSIQPFIYSCYLVRRSNTFLQAFFVKKTRRTIIILTFFCTSRMFPKKYQAPFYQIKAPEETLFPGEFPCKRYALYLSLYIYILNILPLFGPHLVCGPHNFSYLRNSETFNFLITFL